MAEGHSVQLELDLNLSFLTTSQVLFIHAVFTEVQADGVLVLTPKVLTGKDHGFIDLRNLNKSQTKLTGQVLK